MYQKFLKPIFDFFASFTLLLVFFPIILSITIVLIFLNNGEPFFKQARPGKFGKVFKMLKFKTMHDRRGKDGNLLHDSERLTTFGRFLRKYSLDELPQLFNVLKGDMSLIGPRPLLPEYLPLYSKEQARRHEVKPGITGWAQVQGRQEIPFSKRFEYDVWYVKNISFTIDLKIIFKTIEKVFSSKGVISGQDVFEVDDVGFTKSILEQRKKV